MEQIPIIFWKRNIYLCEGGNPFPVATTSGWDIKPKCSTGNMHFGMARPMAQIQSRKSKHSTFAP